MLKTENCICIDYKSEYLDCVRTTPAHFENGENFDGSKI